MIDGPITREETHPPEGQESRIQRFFTDRARLYDNIFLGLFRYGDVPVHDFQPLGARDRGQKLGVGAFTNVEG